MEVMEAIEKRYSVRNSNWRGTHVYYTADSKPE